MILFFNDLFSLSLDFLLQPPISLDVSFDPLVFKILSNVVYIRGPTVIIGKEELLLFSEHLFGVGGWSGIKRASVNFLSSSLSK